MGRIRRPAGRCRVVFNAPGLVVIKNLVTGGSGNGAPTEGRCEETPVAPLLGALSVGAGRFPVPDEPQAVTRLNASMEAEAGGLVVSRAGAYNRSVRSPDSPLNRPYRVQ